MRRVQFIEIHEQPWCPAGVRDGATDCLNMLANVGQQYRHVLPLIRRALHATHSTRVIDLCAGGGGPWHSLARRLAAQHPQPVEILLTDRYPNINAQRKAANDAGYIRYLPVPVDATAVPATLTGFRTLFTAFHHFPPHLARRILQDAVDSREGIGIFEQTRRTPFAVLLMLLLPFLALFATPFMRPFRWSRLFWTYIIPAIPWVLCVDGITSCLRTYTRHELRMLLAGLDAPGYTWELGRVPSPLSPLGVTYLVGYPERATVRGSMASSSAASAGAPRVVRTR